MLTNRIKKKKKFKSTMLVNRVALGRYAPDVCHDQMFGKPLLSYDLHGSDPDFSKRIREKFLMALGDMPEPFTPIVREESVKETDEYTRIRLLIETEKSCLCPCLLLLPKGIEKPPVVICLQGHSNGMMLSVGEGYYRRDFFKSEDGDRDFGLQAVENGYAAMIIEQRGFGERRSKLFKQCGCAHLAHNALLLGRTLIGERVWDVSRVIDVLEKRKDVDCGFIGITGNSGGGTASYYAACYEPRIKAVMPGCSVCTYKDSIGSMYHCACNYLPSAAKYFDMGELSCLIYPRPIVIVAGKKDPIFPLRGVKETYGVMKKIYGDKKDRLSLVIGNGAHRFYREGWKEFNRVMKIMTNNMK